MTRPPAPVRAAQPLDARCKHDFAGWRDFADGNGGERFCQKCGLGAMAHTLSMDWEADWQPLPAARKKDAKGE